MHFAGGRSAGASFGVGDREFCGGGGGVGVLAACRTRKRGFQHKGFPVAKDFKL